VENTTLSSLKFATTRIVDLVAQKVNAETGPSS
jgi:hypothetical protein